MPAFPEGPDPLKSSYGPGEVPAVYSVQISQEFSGGSALTAALERCVTSIRDWAISKGYLVGHIKAFAESEGKEHLWLATTGKGIRIEGSPAWDQAPSGAFQFQLAAIVFGPDPDELRKAANQGLGHLRRETVLGHCTIVFQPTGSTVTIPAGLTTREAIHLAGLNYDFPCGGNGTCGKCRVRMLAGAPEPTSVERELLSATELGDGIRLACYARHGADAEILLLETDTQSRILTDSLLAVGRVEPGIRKLFTEVPRPDLEDQRSDWQRLKDSLVASHGVCGELTVSLGVLRRLSVLLREADFKVTAIIQGAEVCGLEKGDTTGHWLGLAFDLGTTTIVGYLLDLRSGQQLCHVSALNPQVKFGGDLISRTAHGNQEGGLEELHLTVVAALNDLITAATTKVGSKPEDIYALSFAGNTCMHHLLLGLSPRSIALAPYVPVVSDALVLDPASFDLKINPYGRAFLLPNVAGYVGGDTVAVVLATSLDHSEGIRLALDIGTNGEMVLGTRDRLIACSTAAGPAFEGAQISSGMRGAEGAIDHVRFGDTFEFSVIGDGKPKGICGSALIDLVAGMLDLGIISPLGRILPPDWVESPKAAPFLGRLIAYEAGFAFQLVDETESLHGRPILLTQGDVRSLQAAKGAIAAGILILCERFGITVGEIEEVFLAGAFGNYMDPRSACAIGLLPRELDGRITMVGNAAGSGSRLALLSWNEFQRACSIARNMEYLELGGHKDFNTVFVQNSRF